MVSYFLHFVNFSTVEMVAFLKIMQVLQNKFYKLSASFILWFIFKKAN